MDLVLGVGGVVFTALDFCVGALALVIGDRRARLADGTPPRALNRIERLAALIASSQRLQGLVAGLAVGGIAFAAFFFYQAVSGADGRLVRVVSPSSGQAVPMQINAEVETRNLKDGESVIVLVRPLPDDPTQSYWVQEQALLTDQHRWDSRPVYVGDNTDASGTRFDLCAVITRAALATGAHIGTLPAGPAHCVPLTRQ